ncbi:hypothetical protein JCM11641_003313 [Rhodosporidiobolus odoratus]
MQSLARRNAALLASRLPTASRAASTQSLSNDEAYSRLNEQRRLRPSAPWAIYQPQLTSVSSIVNRATGAALSAAIYAIFLGHVAAPAFGASLDSATMIEAFSSLPSWMQLSAKAAIAFPASYHTLNGFRHLGWDMGYFLHLKSSYMAGYAVIGATAVSTAALLAL